MLSKNSISMEWIVRAGVILSVLLLLGFGASYSHNSVQPTENAMLQGNIIVHPTKGLNADNKVQPSTLVKFSLIVENKGELSSSPGQAYIRFTFAKPLDDQSNSTIFQTEKVALPSINPRSQIELNFSTTHQWPSLMDFIRNDWLMREYQAIVLIDQNEKTIGTLAITFSAYYYPGVHREFLEAVPALNQVDK